MFPIQVLKYYKSFYFFNKQTGMSGSSLFNWVKWGYVPYESQIRIQKFTDGILTADWDHSKKRTD